MKTWKCTIKERDNDHILSPMLIGDFDRNYCIKFWDLNNPDVEWYKLEEVNE